MSFFIYKSHISLLIRTISLQVDLDLPTTLIYHLGKFHKDRSTFY